MMSDTADHYHDGLEVRDQPVEGDTPEPFRPGVFRTRVVPALAIVLVVGLLGLLGYSLFAPESARVSAECRFTASQVCVFEDPEQAEDFTVETFDGAPFQLSAQRGKIVVINFWASWCGPCRDETPLLETAYRTLGDDVVLIGINIQDQESNARAFLDEFQVTYPSSRSGGDPVSIDYGVTGVPETFVIDADGMKVAWLAGPITSVAQLQEMVAIAR